MGKRGEITVECDVQGCHAEEIVPASSLVEEHLESLLEDKGWRSTISGRVICPQCREEGKPLR